MKTKHLISLMIGFCFLVMSATGLMLYFGQKQWHPAETLHILFGLIFLGFAVFHILNNWSSITSYSKSRKESKWQKEFWVAGGIFAVFLIGGILEIPPFMPMAHGMKKLFGGGGKRGEMLAFEKVQTNQNVEGQTITLMIEKDKGAETPIMAIWAEDSTHQNAETLFAPKEVLSRPEGNDEPMREIIEEGEAEIKPFDAKMLPTYGSKVSQSAPNFDKATPFENIVLTSKTTKKGAFYIYVEIKDKDKTELYEATVTGNTFALTTKNGGTLVKKGIGELSK